MGEHFRALLKGVRGLPLRSLGRMVVLIARSAPRPFALVMLLNGLFGFLPVLLLWLGKLVIDGIAAGVAQRDVAALPAFGAQPQLAVAIVAFVLVHIAGDAMSALGMFQYSTLRDTLELTVKACIYTAVQRFQQLTLFEMPELLNIKQRAEASIGRVRGLAMGLVSLAAGLAALIPVLLLSGRIGWWVPLLIFLSALPTVYIQVAVVNRAWSVEQAQAGVVRQIAVVERVLTDGAYAKELRLFGLQALFLQRWQELFEQALAELQDIRRRGTRWTVLAALVSGIGAALPYVFVVREALSGRFGLGDLALYAGLIFEVRRTLYVLFNNAVTLQEAALGAEAIFALLDLAPEQSTMPVAPHSDDTQGVVVDGVTFAYPGAVTPVLRGVRFAMRPGELVVVVGENGAGKTTLAKLLCRFYDPQSGAVRWNGQDIRTLDLATLRARITVVPQDYARFPVSARENIAFGDLAHTNDAERVQRVAEQAGIWPALAALPHGLDTMLSKQFDDGSELSGGQWQRVAIARALMRHTQAELVILDEPTAALDPATEHEIFALLRELARGKMAIVISHRLALARLATRVVVLHRGQIVEAGDHASLMAQQGAYYTMFTRQASSYGAGTDASDSASDLVKTHE